MRRERRKEGDEVCEGKKVVMLRLKVCLLRRKSERCLLFLLRSLAGGEIFLDPSRPTSPVQYILLSLLLSRRIVK